MFRDVICIRSVQLNLKNLAKKEKADVEFKCRLVKRGEIPIGTREKLDKHCDKKFTFLSGFILLPREEYH